MWHRCCPKERTPENEFLSKKQEVEAPTGIVKLIYFNSLQKGGTFLCALDINNLAFLLSHFL